MKLILVSAAALTLVGGTAVNAQPATPDQRGAPQAHGAETSRHWARGDTLPATYRTSSNYVDKAYHLRAPHPGRRWVSVDNDNFAEMSLSTGRIYQITGRR